jgi:hypothetical protein
MYFIGILRGAAMARFISVAWLHCSRPFLLHQTALTAKRAEAAQAVTPILALNGLNGGRRFFAMQSDANDVVDEPAPPRRQAGCCDKRTDVRSAPSVEHARRSLTSYATLGDGLSPGGGVTIFLRRYPSTSRCRASPRPIASSA